MPMRTSRCTALFWLTHFDPWSAGLVDLMSIMVCPEVLREPTPGHTRSRGVHTVGWFRGVDYRKCIHHPVQMIA